jgi:hypothetical protein
MFLTLHYPNHQEQIPIKSILKFVKFGNQDTFDLTLSEVFGPEILLSKMSYYKSAMTPNPLHICKSANISNPKILPYDRFFQLQTNLEL